MGLVDSAEHGFCFVVLDVGGGVFKKGHTKNPYPGITLVSCCWMLCSGLEEMINSETCRGTKCEIYLKMTMLLCSAEPGSERGR